MKKIICFTESLGGGGAEHQMVILAELLAREGYDVTIVTYATIPDHYDTPQGVKRIDIGKTWAKRKNTKAIIKMLKCFHYFLWLKADCIIAYRECANLRLLPPMLFRNRKSIKVICSDRNTATNVSLGQKLLLCGLYRRADFIVPNSKTETEFIARYSPHLMPKLRTIQNYTDLHQFVTSGIPVDISVIKVAIFSRYSPQKNPIGFAKAMHNLKSRTNQSFEVHWYGKQKGTNGYTTEYLNIKKLVDELGIGDVLKLYPAVKNPALLMGNYHAVCLASLYEGFSNSIAEGICSGKPMLVSNVSDNSIMVHHGENGFLFTPELTDSIVDAFMKFFSLSHDEMCLMARRSREIAEELFDKKKFIQQYIDLIESNEKNRN